jgi:hypothetical protein
MSTRLSSSLYRQVSGQNPKEGCIYALLLLSTKVYRFGSGEKTTKGTTNGPHRRDQFSVALATSLVQLINNILKQKNNRGEILSERFGFHI